MTLACDKASHYLIMNFSIIFLLRLSHAITTGISILRHQAILFSLVSYLCSNFIQEIISYVDFLTFNIIHRIKASPSLFSLFLPVTLGSKGPKLIRVPTQFRTLSRLSPGTSCINHQIFIKLELRNRHLLVKHWGRR